MANLKTQNIHDVLSHLKTSDKEDGLILPITRYENVLNAPNVVSDAEQKPGAPFHLLAAGSEGLTYSEIRKFCGPII